MPSVGRTAIAATARAFMTAYPDMVVRLERVEDENGLVVFHWIWTGTNSGPGGTDRFVRIRGYEEWTMEADGHIAQSKGHYDEAELPATAASWCQRHEHGNHAQARTTDQDASCSP